MRLLSWLVAVGSMTTLLSRGASAQVQTVTIDVGTGAVDARPTLAHITLKQPIQFIITGLKSGQSVGASFVCEDGNHATISGTDVRITGSTATFEIPASGTVSGDFPAIALPCDASVIIDGKEVKKVEKLGQAGGAPASRGGESIEEYARRVFRARMADPYDIHDNRVYIVLGSNGRMLTPMPTNVDQDDRFVITVVALRTELPRYDIRVDEGEYAPSDFVLRPTAAIELEAHAQSTAEAAKVPYDTLTVVLGPYTTSRTRFTLTYDDTTQQKVVDLRSHAIRINPLYHAALGVGIVRTNLPQRSFDVVPLNDTQNTIRATEDGSHSIGLVSAILYWNVLSPDFWRGGAVTRGRDPLKESSVLDRIFPMIGIGLDKKLADNVFFGGVFEITRGASIVAGWHYGKTTQLADPSFQLGSTPFNGTSEDIRTIHVWRTRTFYGATLDTRLLGGLFGLVAK